MTWNVFATTLASWLKATAIGHAMVRLPWLWPVCETLHFVGLTLVIGVAGLLDLRLLGVTTRMSVRAVMDLRPWAAVGLLINLATGLMFFAGAPDQYLKNPAWWWKLVFLAIAGVNIALFEFSPRTKALATSIGPGVASPRSLRIAGAVSLVSWFFVLYLGRMLPFIGNAF